MQQKICDAKKNAQKGALKKFFAKNGEFVLCFALLGVIFVVAFDPEPIIDATFGGLVVWAKIVLPSLFCFFVLTKLFLSMPKSQKVFAPANKVFQKIFGVKNHGGFVFFASAIVGYPIGAKLIAEFFLAGEISHTEAHKMIAFASTSGPMFVLGSMASKMFSNTLLGAIVLVSHLIGAVMNGLIFKNFCSKAPQNFDKNSPNLATKNSKTGQKVDINTIMLDSITSVLMVGGFISICFAGLELFENLFVFDVLKTLLPAKTFEIFEVLLRGFVEVTSGCVALAKVGVSAQIKSVLACVLVSFGGLCIHLQSNIFLKKVGIKYKYFLQTKTCHAVVSGTICLILSAILL